MDTKTWLLPEISITLLSQQKNDIDLARHKPSGWMNFLLLFMKWIEFSLIAFLAN